MRARQSGPGRTHYRANRLVRRWSAAPAIVLKHGRHRNADEPSPGARTRQTSAQLSISTHRKVFEERQFIKCKAVDRKWRHYSPGERERRGLIVSPLVAGIVSPSSRHGPHCTGTVRSGVVLACNRQSIKVIMLIVALIDCESVAVLPP